MAKITFYPLGNADCCLIETDKSKLFAFDYADMHNPQDSEDKRMPLKENFKKDMGWPNRKNIDVLAITHGDDDHVSGIRELFWLDHALKYQGDERIKINELWVPAALIVEEGSEDCTRVIREEAKHRLLAKKGIKVFSRPEHLRSWFSERELRMEDYQHLIVDAGRLVPDVSMDVDGVEFFVHSPFAERDGDTVLDRNENCLVMQAVLRSGGRDTRFLITADSVADNWQRMVKITRLHSNEARLAWDVLKLPHHCSYLSMSHEKGEYITTPTVEFKWMLEQGADRAVMVSSSWPIPSETEDQPPHVETHRRYKETADTLDADLVTTMSNPTKTKPERTVISVDGNGPTFQKAIFSATVGLITSKSPRVG
ncbi:MAG: hypothetical protein JWM68_1203 [Verrucomicrobiales bacterium]|nr:hypothetical protein [Verrucomicrobiales bacterium]